MQHILPGMHLSWTFRSRALLLGAAMLAAWWTRGHVLVNFTASMPIGVYRRLVGPAKRGDMVVACMPEAVARFALARGYVWKGGCPGGASPIGKKVVAMADDTVLVSEAGVLINGRLIPESRPLNADKRGRVLDHFPNETYRLRANELWLLSTYHPLSFDSRYFGPIPKGAVLGRVEPILTTSAQ
jgi:conjugative transfer signal peptidase TraF